MLDEIFRIQVKEGFDPLVQFRASEKDEQIAKKTNSVSSDPIVLNEKNYIEEKIFGINYI